MRQSPTPTSHAATVRRRRLGSFADDGETTPLLDLATSPPDLLSGLVRRPGLVQRLLDAPDAPLAIIVAPPGYGKSTLLAEWAERDPRPFVWLALGEREPGTISALTGLPPAGAPDGLARLVRQMASRHSSFVVVLDDAHLVEQAVLRDFVETALQHLPRGSTVALASRTDPGVPIGRLRAHRQLVEIRLQQLAMSPEEAAALFRNGELDLDYEQVRGLVLRTEGWAAALYLASLAAREDSGCLARFGGAHHLVSDYLKDEVISPLPADAIRFAVRTSVLDELSGPICDAVLDQPSSVLALQQLARLTPLLVPVDLAHQTYRWHSLMRPVLESELRRTQPKLEPSLRQRAGDWYSSHGEIDRAIAQASAAHDAELTGRLLWQNILAYLPCGRNNRMHAWLRVFCNEEIAECPPLALAASLSALVAGDGDQAQHWAMAAAAAAERSGASARLPSLTTGLAVAQALIATDGVDRMGALVTGAYNAEGVDSMWRPVCLLLAGLATHLRRDRAAADPLLQESIRLAGSGKPALRALALAQRAMIAIEIEDWESAEELTDSADAVIEAADLKADPGSAIVFAAAAATHAHRGRIDEAKSDLRAGVDLLAEFGDVLPWYGAEARILLAHASLSLADVAGARRLLAQASRLARRTAGAKIFSDWFDQAWARMDTVAESSLVGPSSLTIAELRILRFLPSHRSFREIGAQLGVSANTVKTQAHAVYRKLGVASRSQAVAHAMDTGLLGH